MDNLKKGDIKKMAKQKVNATTSKKQAKKSGCVNLAVVQAGYSGKRWTI